MFHQICCQSTEAFLLGVPEQICSIDIILEEEEEDNTRGMY